MLYLLVPLSSHAHASIDCGANGFAFIDEAFARHHLPLAALEKPRPLEIIDGRPIASGDITHMTTVLVAVQEHYERLPVFATNLGHYSVVLGIPWLRHHDVAIRFASNLVTFGSQHCLTHCTTRPVTVSSVLEDPPEDPLDLAPLSAPQSPDPFHYVDWVQRPDGRLR